MDCFNCVFFFNTLLKACTEYLKSLQALRSEIALCMMYINIHTYINLLHMENFNVVRFSFDIFWQNEGENKRKKQY